MARCNREGLGREGDGRKQDSVDTEDCSGLADDVCSGEFGTAAGNRVRELRSSSVSLHQGICNHYLVKFYHLSRLCN